MGCREDISPELGETPAAGQFAAMTWTESRLQAHVLLSAEETVRQGWLTLTALGSGVLAPREDQESGWNG